MKPVNEAAPRHKPARRDRRGRKHAAGGPVTVRREVPVTILTDPDGGRRVVNHDTDEPCFGCPCCALWARSLDELAAAIRDHEDAGHTQAGAPRDFTTGEISCLVCAMLAGLADGPAHG